MEMMMDDEMLLKLKMKLTGMKCFFTEMGWMTPCEGDEMPSINHEAVAADIASTEMAESVRTLEQNCFAMSQEITEVKIEMAVPSKA